MAVDLESELKKINISDIKPYDFIREIAEFYQN